MDTEQLPVQLSKGGKGSLIGPFIVVYFGMRPPSFAHSLGLVQE